MKKTLAKKLFPLFVAGAIFAGGCANSQPYHLKPVGETPSGETTYKKVPENYANKDKNKTASGEVAGCLLQGASFMFHLGGL